MMSEINKNIQVLQLVVSELIKLTGKKDELDKIVTNQYLKESPTQVTNPIDQGYKDAIESLGLNLIKEN